MNQEVEHQTLMYHSSKLSDKCNNHINKKEQQQYSPGANYVLAL